MPTCSGGKGSYGTWKAAFTICVDNLPITAELKLLRPNNICVVHRLRALKCMGIQLLHTELHYEVLNISMVVRVHMEALDKMVVIPDGNGAQMERFADLHKFAVINLKDTGQGTELHAGVFYQQLLKKLSSKTLTKYYRQVHLLARTKSVENLAIVGCQ